MTDCYIVNLSHIHRKHKYITVWRPDNCGYAWPLSWAGKYPLEKVMANLHYYNTGTANIAVPCEVLDAMAVNPDKGDIDGNKGPVVLNNRENWNKIIASCVAKPPYEPQPVYKGSRRYDWEVK
jgi:hypothetical protein